jgi:hypothetical protein
MPRESGGIQYSSGIGDYLNRRGVLDRLVKQVMTTIRRGI